jgi:tetratricopeptide (TPR) repeat protein
LAGYEAENFLGVVLEMRCDYAEAEKHYVAALQLAQALGTHASIAKICTNLGSLLVRNGHFDKAEEQFHLADKSLKAMGRIAELHVYKINWAFLYNLSGQHEKTLSVVEDALAYFTAPHPPLTPYQTALFQQALAEAYLGLGKLDKAEECAHLALSQEETDILPDTYRTLGEIMLAYERWADAEQWIRQSLRLLAQNPDPYLEGFAQRSLAQVYYKQGKDSEAEEAKQKALSLFAQIKLLFEETRTQSILSNL